MFDRLTRETDSALYKGPRLYLRIEALKRPQLLSGLGHSNFWVRLDSLLILKKHHVGSLSGREIEKVGESLQDSNGRVREAAADLLGAAGARGRAILLSKLDSRSEDEAVAAGIGLLNHPEGLSKSHKSQALQRLLNCLGRCDLVALNYLNNHHQSEAIPWLTSAIFDAKTPAAIRKQAADVFSHTATRDQIPELKRMLESPDRNVRFSGVAGLRNFLSEDVIATLIRHTSDSDAQVRHWVFLALVDSESSSVLPVLRRGLLDSSDDVVSTAIAAVEKRRDLHSLPALIEILRGQEPVAPELTRTQVKAGTAISSVTGQTYKFGLGFLCAHPAMAASAQIQAGRELGGEAGRKMIEDGERNLREYRERRDAFVAKTDLQNINSRKDLLAWWDKEGRKKFRIDNAVER